MNARAMTPPSDAMLEEAASRFRALRTSPNDPAQQAAFRAWLESDPEHAAAADLVVAAWRDSDQLAERPYVRNLRADALAATERKRRVWLRPAFASLLLLVAGSAGVVVLEGKTVREQYATARGERLDVALADGSRLRINGDTRIAVAFGWFGRDLRIEQGEAEFVVAKDRLRPFVVDAGRMGVRAVGTDFSVRRDGDTVAVVLAEGVVALQPAQASFTPVTMQAGAKAVLAANAAAPSIRKADLALEFAWRDGQVIFNRTPLAEALRELGRYSAARVELQNADLGRLEVSGGFRATDLQSFLEIASRIHALKWQRTGDGLYRIERR